jgi:hypothetical protein
VGAHPGPRVRRQAETLLPVESVVLGDLLVGAVGAEPGERTQAAGAPGPLQSAAALGGGFPLPPASDVLHAVGLHCVREQLHRSPAPAPLALLAMP